jgi:hypothetical protein
VGTWGRLYWPYFLVLASLLFAVPEIIALATNRANTLSDYAHHELNVTVATVANGVHTLAWYVSLAGWLLFVVLITWHIWWAGP